MVNYPAKIRPPLPKLTVNGIDGFLSGKWTFAQNPTYDDVTLSYTPKSQYDAQWIFNLPCLPNTVYTLSASQVDGNGAFLAVSFRDSSNAVISNSNGANNTLNITFTTPSNCTNFAIGISSRATSGFTQCIFKNLMLNLGSTPAPYSKKTGDKMVMPTYKGLWQFGDVDTTGKVYTDNTSFLGYIPCKQNTNYVLSTQTSMSYGGSRLRLVPLTQNIGITNFDYARQQNGGVYLSTFDPGLNTINTGNATVFACFAYAISSPCKYTGIQLEQGTTATTYQPYAVQVNKKPQRKNTAKTGLAFNGVTGNFFQLPSMSMDSVEIDCLIDSAQPNGNADYYLIDARNGLSNGYFTQNAGIGSGWNSLVVDGVNKFNKLWSDIPKGTRTKIKLNAINSFTDDVSLFGNGGNICLKTTVYKVTCYLNGGIVAQYDFENPRNIVGNQLIPNAQNLIPNFEDSRWSIHPNAKVMGKDVLHLDATGANQNSNIAIPVNPNGKYLVLANSISKGCRIRIGKNDGVGGEGTFINSLDPTSSLSLQITIPSDTNSIYLNFKNDLAGGGAGSFDFIRPQFYQLTGQEGTINGAPVLQFKYAKRRLYAKR